VTSSSATRTGDFEFTGRNDDMMKIAGQWVSTVWVEQALAEACGDSVQQIAAVGVSAADGLAALSVLGCSSPNRGRRTGAPANGERASRALPKHRRPRWVHWVEALPMTYTGKVQRSRLRQLHEVGGRRRAQRSGRTCCRAAGRLTWTVTRPWQ
jgi:acyl-coenzyme A synthetase/AMP-(fatty) acid ligase